MNHILKPEYLEIVFNFAAMASVVHDGSDVIVTGHFRSYTDFIGLVFKTGDDRMHKDVKYEKRTDFHGVSLTFRIEMLGRVASFSNVALIPSMVIRYLDDRESYVTMGFLTKELSGSETVFNFTEGTNLSHPWIAWDSEKVIHQKFARYEDIFDEEGMYQETIPIYEEHTALRGIDYALDYVSGKIFPIEGGDIDYGSDILVTYRYKDQENFEIYFSDLYEGTHPDNLTPINPVDIKEIIIPIIPIFFTEGRHELTGMSEEVRVTFKDWKVLGGEISELKEAAYAHPFRMAEGYDDEYYRNPYRLVQSLYRLGYRKVINLYVGASHYYDKKGPHGASSLLIENQVLIPTVGVVGAVKMWYRYLLKAMTEFGFEEIIVSMSMENLQLPESWKQRLYNGEAGRTGWEPPTSFFSPTNPEVRVYWERVVRDYLDISAEEGFKPILQLGEPWWWWQEFEPGDISKPYPGRPPCFYDEATMALYQSEKGKPLPIFTDSNIFLSGENLEAIRWLRDQLGGFSNFAKDIIKSYPNGEYTVLFFPPSVLDEKRVPEALRIVNYPIDDWKNPKLDFIQIEDYDWVVYDNPNHPFIFDFALRGGMRYQHHLTEYFSGFAWEQFGPPIPVQWERVEKAALKALSAQMKNVFIWAGTQVRRDDWSPKWPIHYLPSSVNRAKLNIEPYDSG